LEAARFSYRDTLDQAAADARTLLARLVFLTARQGALEESLAAARQALHPQRVRLEKGDLPGNDYDRLPPDTPGRDADVPPHPRARAGCGCGPGSDRAAARGGGPAVPRPPGAPARASLDAREAAPVAPETGVNPARRRRPAWRASAGGEEWARGDPILARR